MTTSNQTDKQTKSHSTSPTVKKVKEKIISDKLSDLDIAGDLYFSLNYNFVKVPKSGMIAKLKKQTEALDIDLACVLFDIEGNQLDLIWYKNLRDKSEAIIHYGDELTGFRQPKNITETTEGKNSELNNTTNMSPVDLESIHISLPKLSDEVHHIALLVSSFQNTPLCKVPAGQIDIEDVEGNTALHVNLTNLPKNSTSFWLASIIKTDSFYLRNDQEYRDWRFIKKEQGLTHARIEDLVQQIQQQL